MPGNGNLAFVRRTLKSNGIALHGMDLRAMVLKLYELRGESIANPSKKEAWRLAAALRHVEEPALLAKDRASLRDLPPPDAELTFLDRLEDLPAYRSADPPWASRALLKARKKIKKVATGDGAWSIRYQAYLRSKAWRIFRSAIVVERGAKCEKCSATKQLHVHHVTYERLGRERPEDVLVVCKPCHEAIHGRSFDAPREPPKAPEPQRILADRSPIQFDDPAGVRREVRE